MFLSKSNVNLANNIVFNSLISKSQNSVNKIAVTFQLIIELSWNLTDIVYRLVYKTYVKIFISLTIFTKNTYLPEKNCRRFTVDIEIVCFSVTRNIQTFCSGFEFFRIILNWCWTNKEQTWSRWAVTTLGTLFWIEDLYIFSQIKRKCKRRLVCLAGIDLKLRQV